MVQQIMLLLFFINTVENKIFTGPKEIITRPNNFLPDYTEIFSASKIENFIGSILIFFLFLLKT